MNVIVVKTQDYDRVKALLNVERCLFYVNTFLRMPDRLELMIPQIMPMGLHIRLEEMSVPYNMIVEGKVLHVLIEHAFTAGDKLLIFEYDDQADRYLVECSKDLAYWIASIDGSLASLE